MPILPLIADPAAYRPCIQDLLADGPIVREYWLKLFEEHVGTLGRLPVGNGVLADQPVWPAFREDYLAGLATIRRQPDLRRQLTVLELTRYREERFVAHGIHDPFQQLKDRENTLAISLLPPLLHELDQARGEEFDVRLARGLMAGNLFDMGSRAAVEQFESGGFDFAAVHARVKPRPWAVDDLDAWKRRLQHEPPYQQAIFFVDNAGADILLGVLPFVRRLGGLGTRVVLAANSRPALNDVTAGELRDLLARCRQVDSRLAALLHADRLAVVESGCETPLMDLRDVSAECAAAAAVSDLLILEGMGRAIESNYDARFTVDTLKIALVKDPMVASLLGAELFDPVFRFEPAS